MTSSPSGQDAMRAFFNTPLQMKAGPSITMGSYLFNTLPHLLDDMQAREEQKMLRLTKLLARLLKSKGDDRYKELAKLQWEDGSMEAYWGDTKTELFNRLNSFPDEYFSPVTEGGKFNVEIGFLPSAISNAYPAAIDARKLKSGMDTLMTKVCGPVINGGKAEALLSALQDLDEVLRTETLRFAVKPPGSKVIIKSEDQPEKPKAFVAAVKDFVRQVPQWVKDGEGLC